MTTFATGSRVDALERGREAARALRARDDDDAIGPAPTGPTRIPAARYYSPEFAKLEIEQMWPRVWQMACTTDHVAEPGDYFEYRVGPYSVLIVHGDDGVLRAFQNTCRHRGNALCVGTGTGLRELKCGYHGWTWDLSGMLRRVPARKGFGSLHLSDYPLLPALADTWENFVFINMDVNAIPLADYLEEMPGDIAWCGLSEFHCTATLIVDVDANWKTIADGFSETYHIQTLHPELLRCVDDIHAPQQIWGHAGKSHQPYGVASPRFSGSLTDQEVWDSYIETQGGRMGVTESVPLPPLAEGETVQDAVAAQTRKFYAEEKDVDLSAYTTDEITRLHQYNVFPNMSTLAAADQLTALMGRPGATPDTGQLVMFSMTRFPPGTPRTKPMDLHMTAEQATLGQVLDQDLRVLDQIQRGLHSPGFTHLVISNEERRLINTHRNLERYIDVPESERMTFG
jgi:phenylpropionate dioxygenase-like ring-hydroxylating dioxygenase large terminal subunit